MCQIVTNLRFLIIFETVFYVTNFSRTCRQSMSFGTFFSRLYISNEVFSETETKNLPLISSSPVNIASYEFRSNPFPISASIVRYLPIIMMLSIVITDTRIRSIVGILFWFFSHATHFRRFDTNHWYCFFLFLLNWSALRYITQK